MARRQLEDQATADASSSAGARRPAAPARQDAQDAWCSEQARRVQASRRGWVVMWSVWHRTFTAFGCFSPDHLVIDEPTLTELTEHMLYEELRHIARHR